MTTEAFEAWVLHKRPSGDTSVEVTFFTREKGLMRCLCKGGRTPKKQAILQAFTPIWLAVEARKDWYYSRQIESSAMPLVMKGHGLFAALYINELLYYCLKPSDPAPTLFQVYLQTLNGLSAAEDNLAIEILLRQFEWKLLVACGQAISLTEEAYSTHSISPHAYYRFVATEGFWPAPTGLSGKSILALSQGCFDDILVLRTAKLVMRQAIDHLLEGKVLKSRHLFIHYRSYCPKEDVRDF
jgi:DNA repair protein RecO (recombination protein O)